jgi:hypothetical protein
MKLIIYGYFLIGTVISFSMYWRNRKEKNSFGDGIREILYGPKRNFQVYMERFALSITIIIFSICWPLVILWITWSWLKEKRTNSGNQLASKFISNDFLVGKVSPIEVEAQHLLTINIFQPPIPFGHMYKGWIDLLSHMEEKDELWSFSIPNDAHVDELYSRVGGVTRGFSVVRKQKIICEFVYEGG